jgi:hypothetical protein
MAFVTPVDAPVIGMPEKEPLGDLPMCIHQLMTPRSFETRVRKNFDCRIMCWHQIRPEIRATASRVLDTWQNQKAAHLSK